jgi:threonine/homoserine/homoserine lactone efflux protein
MPEFLLTSLLIELTPGPNMAWLAALALAKGRRPAIVAVAGVATGLAILGVLAALGLGAAVIATPWLYQTIRGFGFLYLLWLAWETWQPAAAEEGGFGSFRDGFVTNLLNPKAGLFYVTVLPAFVDPAKGSMLNQTLVHVAAYVGVATAIHAAIVIFASALRGAIVAENRIMVVRRGLALGLVTVALWFLWKT